MGQFFTVGIAYAIGFLCGIVVVALFSQVDQRKEDE